VVVEDLTEARRDRYLPTPEAFDIAQRAFFAQPSTPPVAGWETAESAGARFMAAMNIILSQCPADESLAVVGHATVFSLYEAYLRGVPPSYDVWRKIGFAAIMEVDRATLRPLTPFVELNWS
jgi:broad specificity phosphatase PhoE